MSGLLVIGRSGQVARALAEQAPGAIFLGREALDLADPEAIGPAVAAARPEVVINAAAYTAVDRAEAEPDLAHRINAEAVGALATAAARAGAALVHVSTDYVYPGTGTAPNRETDPTGPVNVYGASKLAGERAASAANPRTTILRTAWVYAPWGQNFLRTMLRLADRDALRVVADQVGHPTSAEDVARACLAAAAQARRAEAGAPCFGVFNYAGSEAVSWKDFAERIFAAARAAGTIAHAPRIEGIPTADYPTPAARPLNGRLDCSAIRGAIPGADRAPLDAAIRRTIARLERPL